MITYTLFIILISIFIFYIKKGKYNAYDFIVLTILIFFSGLRCNVGSDYNLYENMYLNVTSMAVKNALGRTGFGYYYFSLIIHHIWPYTINLLLLIISSITCICVYKFCKENSTNPAVSILLFVCLGFYTASFNTFRQILSEALFLMGYTYLNKNCKTKAVLFFIFSVLFHKVALLFIAIVFLIKIFKIHFDGVILLILGISAVVLYDYIYAFLVSNISAISVYSETNEFIPGIGTFAQILVYFVIYILVNCSEKKLSKNDKFKAEHIQLFYLGFIVMMFGVKNTLFMRLSNYFVFFAILLIADLFELYNLRKDKRNIFIFYLCCLSYFFVFIHSFGEVIPYHSVLSVL